MKRFDHTKLIAGLLLSAVLSGFFSCKKALEQYNPGGLTAEAVFSSPDGFETLVNAAYSYQRWWYGKAEGIMLSEMGTDIWNQGNAADDPGLTDYVNLESTDEYISGLWANLYAAVNVCNYGIQHINEAGLSASLKTTREAELRFLRAFYYWHIVETWGAAPMPLEATDGILTTATRTPVDTIYSQIFEDLAYADANLPVTTGDFGRVTKPAAEAFLARMYLTRGQYQQASDMADKVINDYSFHLLGNYADLWPMEKMATAEANEVIYAVNYTVNPSLNDLKDKILFPYGHGRAGNNAHMDFIMKYDNLPGMMRTVEYGRPFVLFMPTRSLLNLYDESIDSRYDASFMFAWYCNNSSSAPAGMHVGDTAAYCTRESIPSALRSGKLYRIYDVNDVYNADGTIKDYMHFVQMKKFMDPTRTSVNEQKSARDVFVIRLAEMYLIAAEAQFKLNNTQKAADYINVIRERAANPGHKTDMDVKSSDITLDFILDEWAREFAGEQMRWFVLKRNGKLVDRVTAYNPDAAPNIKPFHTVRPIPQDQLDAVTNPEDFKQNPEYK